MGAGSCNEGNMQVELVVVRWWSMGAGSCNEGNR